MTIQNTLKNALPIVATAYGDKFGVKVRVGGKDAMTDGKTIIVPNVPESYPHKNVLWGYLAHEAAHVRFTDFNTKRLGGFHAYLENILEDARIEQEMIKLFPGTAYSIAETVKYLIDTGGFKTVSNDDKPATVLAAYCLYFGRARIVGQTDLNDHLESASQAMKLVFPVGVFVRLNALLRKVAGAKSTSEISEIASEILKMIEEEQEKEQEKADQQQSGQGNSQDQAQGNSQGQAQGNSQGQDQGGSQGQDQGNSQGDCSGDQDSADADQFAKALQSVLDATDDDVPSDVMEALKQDLQDAQDDKDSGDIPVQIPKPKDARENEFTGRNMLDIAASNSSRIRAEMIGFIQSQQRKSSITKRTGRSINTRHLCRIVNGDTRVFNQRADKQSPNTAVHILVDMSSSMMSDCGSYKTKADVAQEAAIAIALALDMIQGANPAVTTFGGHAKDPVRKIVGHGERVKAQYKRFGASTWGYTPMTEAIWYGANELSKTKENRKMLIVITDGQPDEFGSCKRVIELCERFGVEVIGIGIETNSVVRLFKQNIVISDAKELKGTLFTLMRRGLSVS